MKSKRFSSTFLVMDGLMGLPPFAVARAWSASETRAIPSFAGSVMYSLIKASLTIWYFSFPLTSVLMGSAAASASFWLAGCPRMA